jgi:hypothetical protein
MQEPPSSLPVPYETYVGGAVFVIAFALLFFTRPPFLLSQDTRPEELKTMSWPLLFTASLISACIVTFYK